MSPTVQDGASFARSNAPWRSPVATLPLWPLLIGVVAWAFAGLFPTAVSHGLQTLLLYLVPLSCWWRVSRQRGHSVRDVLGAWPTLREWALVLGAVLAVAAFNTGWLAVLASLDLIPDYWKRAAETRPPESISAWPTVLAVVLLAPIVEELLFRGIVFRRSLRRMRPVLAALWSGLLFGVLHLDILGSLVFGLLMVALSLRSNTLWVAIAAHALYNATAGVAGAVVEARSTLGWVIAGAQLLAVPWLVWFVYRSLSSLSLRQPEPAWHSAPSALREPITLERASTQKPANSMAAQDSTPTNC